MRHQLSTVRGRLVALVLLALVPFLALILVSNINERQTDRLGAQNDALSVAQRAADEQDKQIEVIRNLLVVTSRLPDVRSAPSSQCDSVVAVLRSPYDFVANLGMINLDGDLLCSAIPASGPTNLADRRYFSDTIASREFSVGDYQIGRVTGLASINFGYPLTSDSGQLIGVVFAALDLQGLNNLAAEAELPQGSTLTIIDRQGVVLARYPASQALVGQSIADSELFSFLRTAPEMGTTELPGLDGSPRLYGFTTLRAGPTSVAQIAVGIPAQAAFAKANQDAARQLAALALAALAGLALAYLGSESLLLRPIRKLVNTTEALARGELGARVGETSSMHELGMLSRAFDQMAAALEARQAEQARSQSALRASEARFHALAEEALVGVYITQDGIFQYVNPVMATIFGYTQEEIVGHLGPMDLTHPDDKSLVTTQVERRLTGEVTSVHYTFKGLTKSGRAIEAEVLGGVVDLDGTRAIIGTLMDVTDRRSAEMRIASQVRRLNALRAIDMAITASLDPRVTFNVLLDQATTELQVDAADILYLDPHTRTLGFAAGRGFRTDALRHTRLRLGEGTAGRAAQDRELVVIPDLSAAEGEFGRSPHLKDEGFASYVAVPLISKGMVQGVLEIFNRTPLLVDREWTDFLEALAGQAAIAIDNSQMFDELQKSNLDLVEAYDTTLEGWSKALELRDQETQGHAQRVTELTLRLAQAMGMEHAVLVHVRRGALLHDIGKMGIPDEILHKPGPLTDKEWRVMRQHPSLAYELLEPIEFLKPALDIPYCHHEKWDGSGYPRGLGGETIPLSARIFAVVDVWDALRSDRPYRRAWPDDEVVSYLREQSGHHFDPAVLDTFLKLEPDVKGFMGGRNGAA